MFKQYLHKLGDSLLPLALSSIVLVSPACNTETKDFAERDRTEFVDLGKAPMVSVLLVMDDSPGTRIIAQILSQQFATFSTRFSDPATPWNMCLQFIRSSAAYADPFGVEKTPNAFRALGLPLCNADGSVRITAAAAAAEFQNRINFNQSGPSYPQMMGSILRVIENNDFSLANAPFRRDTDLAGVIMVSTADDYTPVEDPKTALPQILDPMLQYNFNHPYRWETRNQTCEPVCPIDTPNCSNPMPRLICPSANYVQMPVQQFRDRFDDYLKFALGGDSPKYFFGSLGIESSLTLSMYQSAGLVFAGFPFQQTRLIEDLNNPNRGTRTSGFHSDIGNLGAFSNLFEDLDERGRRAIGAVRLKYTLDTERPYTVKILGPNNFQLQLLPGDMSVVGNEVSITSSGIVDLILSMRVNAGGNPEWLPRLSVNYYRKR